MWTVLYHLLNAASVHFGLVMRPMAKMSPGVGGIVNERRPRYRICEEDQEGTV
jgi:hypothetical protein